MWRDVGDTVKSSIHSFVDNSADFGGVVRFVVIYLIHWSLIIVIFHASCDNVWSTLKIKECHNVMSAQTVMISFRTFKDSKVSPRKMKHEIITK